MKQLRKDYQRIVIKIGASLLSEARVIDQLIPQIADLINPALSYPNPYIILRKGGVNYYRK